jgi:predicted DNA-binding transcriptional regulator AlpA
MKERFNMSKYVTTKVVADHANFSTSHLWKLINRGEGPPFYDVGSEERACFRFILDEIDLWLQSRHFSNTTERQAEIEERAKKRKKAQKHLEQRKTA